jgi:hypothetical protein
MTDYRNPAWTEESRFRGGLDDVIIIPLVFVTLAANKILRCILSILIRLLDYAFPLTMQIVWLPLIAARILGNVIVTAINGALRLLPFSEAKCRRWSISIRRSWSRLRRKISYRAFERVVHGAFEGGMAWVFGKCRHLTPNTALLVIMGAVLWLPISFAEPTPSVSAERRLSPDIRTRRRCLHGRRSGQRRRICCRCERDGSQCQPLPWQGAGRD